MRRLSPARGIGCLALAFATAVWPQEAPTGVDTPRLAAPMQKNPFDTPSDVELGRKTFVTSSGCSYCHANDGTGGRGANLTLGEYRFGGSDAELFETIRNGIPESDISGVPDSCPRLTRARCFAPRVTRFWTCTLRPGLYRRTSSAPSWMPFPA
jgi:mono/diheme cytochrome c family protein